MLNACLNLFVWLLVALDPLSSVSFMCHSSVCFMRLTQIWPLGLMCDTDVLCQTQNTSMCAWLLEQKCNWEIQSKKEVKRKPNLFHQPVVCFSFHLDCVGFSSCFFGIVGVITYFVFKLALCFLCCLASVSKKTVYVGVFNRLEYLLIIIAVQFSMLTASQPTLCLSATVASTKVG